MKKIIALILALTMCAFVLVACDDDNAAESQNPNETNVTTNTPPAETEPPVPVKVNDLNGKTPKELWEAASASYPELNSFELYVESSQEETEDGVTYKWVGTQEAKISGNNLYFKYTDSEYENNVLSEVDEDDCGEATVIDGVGYVDDYEGKLKYSGDGFAAIEYTKDNIAGSIFEEMFGELIPATALEGVELYQLGDEYYFDGTTTADGAEIKFSARFDKNGIPTELGLDYTLTVGDRVMKSVLKITNINKPITITAPADAASYADFVAVDPEGLAKLQEVIQKLSTATSYSANANYTTVSADGMHTSTSKTYRVGTDGNAEISVWNGTNNIYYYKSGTTYYTRTDSNVTEDSSQSVKDMFTECSAWRTNVCALLQQDIQMLKMSSHTYGEQNQLTSYNITVTLRNGNRMTIGFGSAMEYMTVSLIYETGTSAGQPTSYSFSEIGTTQVYTPSLG